MNSRPEGQPVSVDGNIVPPEVPDLLRYARWAEGALVPEQAIDAYRKLGDLCPGDPAAPGNLARLLLTLGRAAEAIQPALRALALAPDDPDLNARAAQACIELGRLDEGSRHARRALDLKPELHALRKRLADALIEAGRRQEACNCWMEVEDRFGGELEPATMMASVYHRAQVGALAERAYLRLLALQPGQEATYNGLAQLYVDHAQFSKARDLALKALEQWPRQAALWNTLALAQASLGLVADAIVSYRKVMEIAPNLATSHSNMLLSMHYSTDVDPDDLAEEHRRWGRLHAPPGIACRTFFNPPEPARRLRVGYFSPDFRLHSVAFFFEALLDHRDRGEFEVYCYGEVRTPDEVTRRIRSKADHYRSIAGKADPEVVEIIRADGIDILIDLAGHTGSSRTTLLGYRPAPVQATYCGYPDTTGIEAVNYRITDWLADPAGVESRYTETLCRLPGCFLCFTPPTSLPDLGPARAASAGAVTFGSFNREFKLSRETYDLWCRILRALPDATMRVKSVAGGDPETRQRQLGEFERRGVAADRIQLVGFITDQKDHLAGYRSVDIALDTYPYHGTTTTLDSLLMSVPVITLAGYHHASRVGISLLTHAGLPELVAGTPDAYVALAVELAGQRDRLAELHRTLRSTLLASPLCDGPRFVRSFEYALRGMWCNWCREQGVALTPGQAAMGAFDFGPLARAR